jgi:hypothetical protein
MARPLLAATSPVAPPRIRRSRTTPPLIPCLLSPFSLAFDSGSVKM